MEFCQPGECDYFSGCFNARDLCNVRGFVCTLIQPLYVVFTRSLHTRVESGTPLLRKYD